jgi:ABC-type transporter MlaC component
MEKTFKINFEEKNYDCKMESNDDQNINITLANECLQKFNGNISLKDIYEKLPVFEDYTMKEFFSVLEDLKDEKFQIKKEKNKYKLNILIKVLNKEKILNIYRYNRSYSI